MIVRFVTLIVIINLIAITSVAGQTATSSQVQQSKKVASKLVSDTANGVEVKLASGEKLKGHIVSVETDSFTFVDKETGKSRSILFTEVAFIANTKLGKGTWIAIAAIAAGAAITLIVLCPVYSNSCR